MSMRRAAIVGVAIVATAAASFTLSKFTLAKFAASRAETGDTRALTVRYKPSHRTGPQEQRVMVYVGKASCSWSNQPDMPSVIEEIKVRLSQQAEREGKGFAAIGIAVDWSSEAALTHLQRFGKFDEIAAGNSWSNSTAARFFWGDFAGAAATPTVILYSREFSSRSGDGVEATLAFANERLIARKVGVDELRAWRDQLRARANLRMEATRRRASAPK